MWKCAHTTKGLPSVISENTHSAALSLKGIREGGEGMWLKRDVEVLRPYRGRKGTCTYTPEYYAVRHYAEFIPSGSRIVARSGGDTPVLVAVTPSGAHVVVAANQFQKV